MDRRSTGSGRCCDLPEEVRAAKQRKLVVEAQRRAGGSTLSARAECAQRASPLSNGQRLTAPGTRHTRAKQALRSPVTCMRHLLPTLPLSRCSTGSVEPIATLSSTGSTRQSAAIHDSDASSSWWQCSLVAKRSILSTGPRSRAIGHRHRRWVVLGKGAPGGSGFARAARGLRFGPARGVTSSMVSVAYGWTRQQWHRARAPRRWLSGKTACDQSRYGSVGVDESAEEER